MSDPVTVVYIAGDGRSGTTVLSRVLGSGEHCIAAGELHDIWASSISGNSMCTCGEPVSECPFWQAVMCRLFPKGAAPDPRKLRDLRASVQAVKHIPFLLFPRIRPARFQRRLDAYVDITERLYRAIHCVSGGKVIVDSSKLAAYALVLGESDQLDVRFVHVVRDSRACVHSWRRVKRTLLADGTVEYMGNRSMLRTALVWNLRNILLSVVGRRFTHRATVRYEEFVRDPRRVIQRVSEEIGVPEVAGHWVGPSAFIPSANEHIFAGNPNRAQKGSIEIRADEEWREVMPAVEQATVAALALPFAGASRLLGVRAR